MKFDPQTTKRILGLVLFIILMDIVGMSIIFPVALYWMGAMILGIACLLIRQVKVKAQTAQQANVFSNAD